MLRNLVEYHWAEHIDDALELLARLSVKTVPLAGGTYLLGLDDDSIEAVVDLRDVGLAYISEDTRKDIHIGAMTTLQNIVDAPLLKNYASGLLSRTALASSSSLLLRNSATLGGTLAAGIASNADILTALSVLEAQVVVRSSSKTSVDLSGGTRERPGLALSGVVYKGKQERRIACDDVPRERLPNELIVEVIFPSISTSHGTAFARIASTPTNVALLNVAAFVEVQGQTYTRVRLAFGGIHMESARMRTVEHALVGQSSENPSSISTALQRGIADFRLPSDISVSGGYRRVSGAKLAQRVLEEATYLARQQDVLAMQSDISGTSSISGTSKESR